MVPRETDRRVRRTKRRLKEALLELIGERDYGSITIRELTERADVGRSTFYSHFDSKEELLFSGFDAWLLSLADSVNEGDEGEGGEACSTGFRFSLPLLRHAATQKRFFRTVVEEASTPRVRRRIVGLIAAAARRELERMSPAVEGARDAEAHAVAGAFVGVLSWWLASGRRLRVEEVDRIFQRTVSGSTAPSPATGPEGGRGAPMRG